MIRFLQCEYRKTRGRYLFLTALVITAAQLCWILNGSYTDEFVLKNGWMMLLYQLPLANAVFLPVLSMVVSSGLCDIEHRGTMFKQLYVIAERGKLYDAKLYYGLMIMLFCVTVSWFITIIFGYAKGFGGDLPVRLYLLYLLFTVIPTAAVYIFQHSLSMIFKNQAIPWIAGLLGAFLGIFSMFLPSFPVLRRMVLWGYYGTLQLVGLFGWTKETRYANAYFEVMKTDWLFFGVLIAAGLAMYLNGRMVFCRKEV